MQSMELENASGISRMAKMTPRRVLQLAREGKMPCYRAGRQVRFNVVEVLDWMKQQAKDQKTNAEEL